MSTSAQHHPIEWVIEPLLGGGCEGVGYECPYERRVDFSQFVLQEGELSCDEEARERLPHLPCVV